MIKRLMTPEILFSIGLLVVVFLVVALISRLLKWKAKKDANGELNYGKIPDWIIVVISIGVVVVIVAVVIKPTLTAGNLVGGIIVAICLCYWITKNAKKDIENDKKSDE